MGLNYLHEIDYWRFYGDSPERDNLSKKEKDALWEDISKGTEKIKNLTSKYKVRNSTYRGPCNPALTTNENQVEFETSNRLLFHHFIHKEVESSDFLYQCHSGGPDQSLYINSVKKGMNKEACLESKRREVYFVKNPRSLIVEISLERPIPEQIKMVKKVASMQQKQLKDWGILEKTRFEPERYQGYLQLLDALDVGAKKKLLLKYYFLLFKMKTLTITQTKVTIIGSCGLKPYVTLNILK